MINNPLIYNKDIKKLEKIDGLTPDEWQLVTLHNALETKIQQICHNIFNNTILSNINNNKIAEFVQVDNGGKLKPCGKIRKYKEGTKKGWPDVFLIFGKKGYNKIIFIEFKRIGCLSSVQITPEQQYYHDWLNGIGFTTYITNNPIFFKNVICKEVTDFLNSIPK